MNKRISKSFKSIFSSLYPSFGNTEVKNSEEYFFFILKNYPDKYEITQLKFFLIIFSLKIRKIFIQDKNISQYIKKLQESHIVLMRKLGSSITSLFGLSTTRSLKGVGTVSNYFDYPTHKNNHITKKASNFPENLEVAIIGSGAGGGIAAHVLSKKYEVGIFDKGSFLNNETNNETFGYHNFYESFAMQQTRNYNVLLLAGKNIGGGTSINWTTSLRTPEKILNEWDELTLQNNYFNSKEFKDSLDFVCKKLNVSADNNHIPQKEIKLAEGLLKNNLTFKIIPTNVSNSHSLDCGFCTFGCGYKSRNNSYSTWYGDSDFNQENIFSETTIKRLIINDKKATHIEVENHSNIHTIAVDKVILSAGSLNTPSILLNSGYKNKHLGRHLKLHPVSGVAGKFDTEQKPWAGSMQGIYSDDSLFKNNNYGYLLEGLPMHPSLFFPFFPNNNDPFDSFIKDYNYWSGSIVLTSDTSSGNIINNKNQPLWSYNFNNFDHNHLIEGLIDLVKSYYLAGAHEIMVASSPTMHWKRKGSKVIEEFISDILNIKNEKYRFLLGSAHQMGTARIHPNPDQGVVDLNGKVHGLNNVFITDSSTFPRCSGVNPMITIQAMSHFLTSKI
jgi:choline dehydrogenase-like flavoprotein